MFLRYSDFKYDIAPVSDNHLMVYVTNEHMEFVS